MNTLDDVLHWVMVFIGWELGDGAPAWLHPLLHIVLIVVPLALGLLAAAAIVKGIRRNLKNVRVRRPEPDALDHLPTSVFKYIVERSRAD